MHPTTATASGPIADVIAEATGRETRENAVLARTGGPAGNAVLTAWTGLVILVLGVAELLTLFDVRGLISWHVAIGALLVPPALMKTASTGWRLVRYYTGNPPYHEAGPPPMLLRLLGPLVVVSTLGLLGTGVLLILIGEQSSRQELFAALGFRVDWLTLHQGFFLAWAGATGLHLLGRIVPAVLLTWGAARRRGLPGRASRLLAGAVVAAAAAVLALVLVGNDGTWGHDDFHDFHGHHGPPPNGARP